jgi:hypothetical protein
VMGGMVVEKIPMKIAGYNTDIEILWKCDL